MDKERYVIDIENIKLDVSIAAGKGVLSTYKLKMPKTSSATNALLNDIRAELTSDLKISGEILEPKEREELKEEFIEKAGKLLKEKLPKTDTGIRDYLAVLLLGQMTGLGKVEFLLGDPNLEEIVITSSKEPIRVYHKKHGWLETNVTVENEENIKNFSNIIARRVGRQITALTPLLDAHLVTGDRANAVLYPISSKGNTITIRKFARDPWTVTDFIKNGTCTSDVFALIWMAIQYELNIIFSGGTASGKTSMLGVCMPFIPPNHRVLSIEDTRELQLPKFLYWGPLVTRQANPEGKGEVTMLDLLVNSLRMRPDRIVLGEIRKGRDAQVLFEAMHTGHSVYATVHADSIRETISRLVNPPISIPSNLLEAVNLNVVMFRDRKKGIRRVYQVGEFIRKEDEGFNMKSNMMYRWRAGSDQIGKFRKSLRFFDDLSRHTGMSITKIKEDMAAKKKILDWMVKHDIRKLDSVGKVMKEYYTDAEKVIGLAKKDANPSSLLKK